MRKGLFIFLILFIFLSACSQQGDNNSYAEKQEGIIVNIEKKEEFERGGPHEGWYYMLVIPDVEDINIANKTEEELEELAREKDGTYYNVNPEMYDELDLEIGTKIIVYYDGLGESDPPVGDAEKIDIVSQKE